jgi:hypothetical protein
MKSQRRWAILTVLIAALLVLGIRLSVDHFTQPIEPAHYSLIEPGLYMGDHTDQPPKDAQVVLNLTLTKDAYSADIYQWQPIPDGPPAPTLQWLGQQVDFIALHRQAGRTVFVHCDAGISRSGMVVTAYIMWQHHLSVADALEFVRRQRPVANPNPAFRQLLAEWETSMTTQTRPGG